MKNEMEHLQKGGKLESDPNFWFNFSKQEVMEHWNYVVHEKSSEKI